MDRSLQRVVRQADDDAVDHAVDSYTELDFQDLAGEPTPTKLRDVSSPLRLPSAAEVAELTELSLRSDVSEGAALVERLRNRGIPLESIYLDLLEPASRRLGTLWADDLCDFTEVTVAVGRLQQLLRGLSSDFRDEFDGASHGRRLLLAPASGENHTFGLFIVADFFARAGWDVWGGPASVDDGMLQLVREEWFDAVGVSVGCANRLDLLAADIATVRRTARNPDVVILVGGPMFVADPALARSIGADGTAANGRLALMEAERILSERTLRS